MNENETYDYIEVVNDSSWIPFLMDGYESFGWEVTEQTRILQEKRNGKHQSRERIGLRRNRHILNKVELTRLQRNFEASVKELTVMEKNKKRKAIQYALTIGLVGTVFMTLSVFAVVSDPPLILWTVLFAVPGFLCWILSFPVYKKLVESETGRINPLIESKYEELYEIMEKGKGLL